MLCLMRASVICLAAALACSLGCSTPLQKAYRGGTVAQTEAIVTITPVEEINSAVQSSQREGYLLLGESTFPGRGDLDVHQMAREQAQRIGASLVLIKITPAGKEVTMTAAQIQTDDGNAATMLQGQGGLSMTNTMPSHQVYLTTTTDRAIYEVKFLVQPGR
jgi:hypothetical protein